MRLRMGPDDRVSERVIVGGVVAALVAGVVAYNVISFGSGSTDARATLAVIETTTTTAVAAAPQGAAAPALSTRGLAGSGVAALQANATADEVVVASQEIPPATPVPNPTCAADVVDAAYAAVSPALGALPASASLRELAAIAAGCSNADATGPVIGLAVDLAALAPVAVAGAGPSLPAGVVDGLAPVMGAIRAGCADVGYASVLANEIPGAATAEVAAAVAKAMDLCAQVAG